MISGKDIAEGLLSCIYVYKFARSFSQDISGGHYGRIIAPRVRKSRNAGKSVVRGDSSDPKASFAANLRRSVWETAPVCPIDLSILDSRFHASAKRT